MKKIIALIFLVTLIVLTACQGNSPQQEASAIDKQIYNQAIESSNLELCKTIESSALEKDCEDAIEGNKIATQAIDKNDLEQCNVIKNQQIKESCEIKIKTNLKKIEDDGKKQIEYEKSKKKLIEIENSGDIERCKELEYTHQELQCETRIYMDKAQEEKNLSLCENIGNKELKDLCEKGAIQN